MKPLLSALNDIPEYRSLLAAIDNGACPAAFSGLSAVHRAHFAAGIRQELNRPVVVVCADEGEAERMARDLAALSGEAVRTLSARGRRRLRPPCCGRWRRGSAPCWSVRWSPFSSAPFPKPC